MTGSKGGEKWTRVLHGETTCIECTVWLLWHLVGINTSSAVVQCRTRDREVAGLIPSGSGRRISFFRVNFLRQLFLLLLLFGYLLDPRATAAVHKRPRSVCQKVQVVGYS